MFIDTRPLPEPHPSGVLCAAVAFSMMRASDGHGAPLGARTRVRSASINMQLLTELARRRYDDETSKLETTPMGMRHRSSVFPG